MRYNTNFQMFVLKILLLKLGIKEVVWQKIVKNFQILSFLYKYFIETGKHYCMS